MTLKVKKLVPHAFIPKRAHPGDAGFDLIAVDCYKNHDYGYIEFGTGLAVEIPEGHVGLIFPRSSITKTSHMLKNAVGVIDSGYRGELKLRMTFEDQKEDMEYQFGDKIGQLVILPCPKVELEETEELSDTERGSGGFGSTGS